MDTEQQKKSFWKTLGKILAVILPIGIALAKSDVIRGTGGEVLKNLPPDVVKDTNE